MSTAMFVALIVLLALQVDTQLTVDDDDTGSCESSTSDQVVNLIREESGLIREDLKDVKLIKDGLKKVEIACTSRASNQPCQSVAVDTSGLCK